MISIAGYSGCGTRTFTTTQSEIDQMLPPSPAVTHTPQQQRGIMSRSATNSVVVLEKSSPAGNTSYGPRLLQQAKKQAEFVYMTRRPPKEQTLLNNPSSGGTTPTAVPSSGGGSPSSASPDRNGQAAGPSPKLPSAKGLDVHAATLLLQESNIVAPPVLYAKVSYLVANKRTGVEKAEEHMWSPRAVRTWDSNSTCPPRDGGELEKKNVSSSKHQDPQRRLSTPGSAEQHHEATEVSKEEVAAVEHTILRVAMGMPFQLHIDALTFLQGTTVSGVDAFGLALRNIILFHLSHSPMVDVPCSIFLDKIASVATNLEKCASLGQDDKSFVLDTVIPEMTKRWFGGASPTVRIPVGRCHGDLTLSNILVVPELEEVAGTPTSYRKGHPTQFILIDFLDSFVESPLADLAKLLQDLRYGWTIRLQRHESGGATAAGMNQYDSTKLFSIFHYLWTDYLQGFDAPVSDGDDAAAAATADSADSVSSSSWCSTYLPPMLMLNQLRVLQYATHLDMAAYLMGTVRAEYKSWERGK